MFQIFLGPDVWWFDQALSAASVSHACSDQGRSRSAIEVTPRGGLQCNFHNLFVRKVSLSFAKGKEVI
jgi:hypothetical protein